jgi:hypothetical protein
VKRTRTRFDFLSQRQKVIMNRLIVVFGIVVASCVLQSHQRSPPAPTCAPCVQPGGFCFAILDPSTCECVNACCSLPVCGEGTYRDKDQCESCFDPGCKCKPKVCDPCPKSTSSFCENVLRPDCTCQLHCCSINTSDPEQSFFDEIKTFFFVSFVQLEKKVNKILLKFHEWSSEETTATRLVPKVNWSLRQNNISWSLTNSCIAFKASQ